MVFDNIDSLSLLVQFCNQASLAIFFTLHLFVWYMWRLFFLIIIICTAIIQTYKLVDHIASIISYTKLYSSQTLIMNFIKLKWPILHIILADFLSVRNVMIYIIYIRFTNLAFVAFNVDFYNNCWSLDFFQYHLRSHWK